MVGSICYPPRLPPRLSPRGEDRCDEIPYCDLLGRREWLRLPSACPSRNRGRRHTANASNFIAVLIVNDGHFIRQRSPFSRRVPCVRTLCNRIGIRVIACELVALQVIGVGCPDLSGA